MAEQEVQNGAEKSAVAVTFTAVKPQLLVEAPKASEAIQFYKTAFGAEEGAKTLNTKRKADQEQPLILSSELKFGNSTILVADNTDDSAETKSVGSGMVLCLETEDVSSAVSKALAAGAVPLGETVQGEGAGVGKVKDPFGFVWLFCPPAKKCADVAA